MKSKLLRFTFPSRWKPDSRNEFDDLIELYPFASILIDWKNQQIKCANKLAADLSGYTTNQLHNLELRKLLPGMTRQQLDISHTPENEPISMLRADRSIVEVVIQNNELLSRQQWSILKIETLASISERKQVIKRSKTRIAHINTIFNQTDSGDLQSDFEKIIQSAIALLGVDSIAIYRLESDQIKLRCQIRTQDWYPEELTSHDIMHLRKPHLWHRGTRSTIELHRLSLARNASYLASTPIGDSNAIIGLLVTSGSARDPDENLIETMELIAGRIKYLFEKSISTRNTLEKLAALEIASAFQRSISNAIQDSVITLTPDLTILDFNRSAEIALGYSADETRNLPIDEILIGSENLLPALNLAQGGIPSFNKQSVRLYRRSGHNFLARVSTLPVTVNGEIQGIIILIRDESERELIQAQNQQLEQRALLGEVTAVFAHEVRNPINNISTGLQLLAYNLAPEDPNQEVIARLQQDCDRLAELMKSVLSFSKPADYEMNELQLDLILNNLIERMRPRITRAHVEPCLQFPEEIPPIIGNPRAVEQVFSNLINNALQAMEEKGGTLTIKIKARKLDTSQACVEVAVVDNGPGIPHENQEKIFQPFFTTKSNGTGLGLAITKRIITAHKGTIRLNSFPGGTVFITQFPVANHFPTGSAQPTTDTKQD
jgi:PAS domain S-box-containing protein